ncbi:MAG: GNAT family N-acetyltransferase [Pseudomonadota bacterium]|nr:GNAT family N-acetyltransferase [Pseudomonadota bacterium]
MIPHIVRRVELTDLHAVVALCAEHAEFERASFDASGKLERLSDAIFGNEHRLTAWIAVVDRQPVGYATATIDFSTWNAAPFLYMDCLFVRPTQRNGGIGLTLFETVRRFARERGLTEIHWQTPAWNTDACRFYRRIGGIDLPKVRFILPT